MNAHDVFEILVREHTSMLTAFIRSLIRDRSLSDDVFQETLLTAWKRLDDFDKSRPFGPWLRGIAANVILAAARQQRKVVWLSDEEVLVHLNQRCEQLHQAPGDSFDEKLELLRGCVDGLPTPYREAVEARLNADDDNGVDALAYQLGVNVETLKKRLQRARARLLECVQRKLAARGPL